MAEKKSEAKQPETGVKALGAQVKALEAENAGLKDKLAEMETEVGALGAKLAESRKAMAALSQKAARADALEKLLARDGPHDPVTKYD